MTSTTQQQHQQQQNGITCMACIKEGSTFVCGYDEGVVRLWDAWTGTCLAVFAAGGQHQQVPRQYISSICSMGDGIHFVAASFDGTMNLWSTTSVMDQHRPQQPPLVPDNNNNRSASSLLADDSSSLVDNEIVLVSLSSNTTQAVSNAAPTRLQQQHHHHPSSPRASPRSTFGRKRFSMLEAASKFMLGESSIPVETMPVKTFQSRSNSAVLSVCCVETAKSFVADLRMVSPECGR
uniref:Uncharacterized protein n=1 Tax=Grammatophora oceanica TaxID=210454 RepID=A0A7S1Y637_9STRA|mmetsp:Transcript_25603/g.37426  ORF Transcript_25603/g.37426 Transcript_25603/m.37426 type:complete len:236 (+) Transcript_25603:382-1089(+)